MSTNAESEAFLDPVWAYLLNDRLPQQQEPQQQQVNSRRSKRQSELKRVIETEKKEQKTTSAWDSWFMEDDDDNDQQDDADSTDSDDARDDTTHRRSEIGTDSSVQAFRGSDSRVIITSRRPTEDATLDSSKPSKSWGPFSRGKRNNSRQLKQPKRSGDGSQKADGSERGSQSQQTPSTTASITDNGTTASSARSEQVSENSIVDKKSKNGKRRGLLRKTLCLSPRRIKEGSKEGDLRNTESEDIILAPTRDIRLDEDYSQQRQVRYTQRQQPQLVPLSDGASNARPSSRGRRSADLANSDLNESTRPKYIDPFSIIFGKTGVDSPWAGSETESDGEDAVSRFSDAEAVRTRYKEDDERDQDSATETSVTDSNFTEIRLTHTPRKEPVPSFSYGDTTDESDGDGDEYDESTEGSTDDDRDDSEEYQTRQAQIRPATNDVPVRHARQYLENASRRRAARSRIMANQVSTGRTDVENGTARPYDNDPDQQAPFQALGALGDEISEVAASDEDEPATTTDRGRGTHSRTANEKATPTSRSALTQDSDPVQSDQPVSRKTKLKQKSQVLLKKLACWSHKPRDTGFEGSIPDLEEVGSLLPRSRVIPDDDAEQASLVTSHSNTYSAVPSSKILESKGPQSVYDYDYGTEEHLASVYTEFNRSPRTDISTWKFSAPPKASEEGEMPTVVIQVEASTVSETDCIIRRGQWPGQNAPTVPASPGVDIVGRIFDISPSVAMEYGLKRWQTVMALTKCGGNARFIKLHPASLVNVPPSLDPAEVVCLAETYLTAFQVLHFGQRGTARYKNTSLKGKSVLIVGAMSNNLGKAMIDLATNANAAVIYATAKKKHWKTLAALGAIPLDQEESEWITRLEESMDLVLATNGANREDVSTLHMKALRPKAGHLIVCGHRVADTDIPVGEWKERKPMQLSWPKQNSSTQWLHYTHGYDVFDQWDTKLDVCQADLKHLLQLLAEGAIKPYVLDRIPLTKVPKAQEVLDSKRLAGHLVCEPWLKSKRRAVGL